MSDLIEVAITSDDSGQLWNSSVWDPRAGTTLMTFKGGNAAAARTLSLIGNDYIVAAERLKPILRIWPINSQEAVQGLRFVCPGRVLALTVTPDGLYCAAGIAEKLHIWQISSGRLLAVTGRHYQPITCIKFTDDSSFVITSGQDGMIIVWSLADLIHHQGSDVISQTSAGNTDPVHILSDHTLPITDIYLGRCGVQTHLVTVSIDKTCRIYDLVSGKILLTLVFKQALASVTMDSLEQNIFVGTSEGPIFQFSLSDPPRTKEFNAPDNLIFRGHSQSVTCLSVSVDSVTLISGSNDMKLFMWHIPSRQIINTILHRGAITNAFFTIAPRNMFKNDYKPNLVLHSFNKSIETEQEFVIEVIDDKSENNLENSDDEFDNVSSNTNISTADKSNNNKLRETISILEKANRELYRAAVEHILNKNKYK